MPQACDLMGPAGHGIPDAEVLISDDWESVRTVVDVGGGTGTQLAEILRARPAVRGTLIDLPRTVARSAEVFHAAGVAERATAIGQSFFDPLPAGADLYLLKKVLDDWPDREAAAILRRCAEAARPAGRVIVLGGVSLRGDRWSLAGIVDDGAGGGQEPESGRVPRTGPQPPGWRCKRSGGRRRAALLSSAARRADSQAHSKAESSRRNGAGLCGGFERKTVLVLAADTPPENLDCRHIDRHDEKLAQMTGGRFQGSNAVPGMCRPLEDQAAIATRIERRGDAQVLE